MKKNTVRLTEAQLHRVIKESVKRILMEGTKPNANPEGAQIEASYGAVGTLYPELYKDSSDFLGKDLDSAKESMSDEVLQHIDNEIRYISSRTGISPKRAMDLYKGYFNRYSPNFAKYGTTNDPNDAWR